MADTNELSSNHVWSVLCTKAIVDQSSNNVSLLDVTEQVTLTLPEEFKKQLSARPDRTLFPFAFNIVTLWSRLKADRPEDQFQTCIDIVLPSGLRVRQQSDAPQTVDLQNYTRFRCIFRNEFVPYAGAGIYKYLVMQKRSDGEKPVAELPLQIVITEETTPTLQ